MSSTLNLAGKTVVLTGGNIGIGHETAKTLAAAGATVIITSRSAENAAKAVDSLKRETNNENIEGYVLDLSDFNSVRSFAQTISRKHSVIDILVNNAAQGFGKELKKNAQGIEAAFASNHLGHFLLTGLLLDLLKKSSSARIVNVSSGAHKLADKWDWKKIENPTEYDAAQAYFTSKLANVFFTQELSRKLKQAGIQNIYVNAVHPGVVQGTGATRNGPIDFETFAKVLNRQVFNPDQGSFSSVFAATDPSIEKENITGKYFDELGKLEDVAPQAKYDELSKQLWTKSEAWTGFKYEL